MKKFILLNLLLLTLKLTVQAQGEANIWYFGWNAGLDFNSASPVVLTDGDMENIEGTSSIADFDGNLLFYTDGDTIWNKNHVNMPNGIGLNAHPSSMQGSMIIQHPTELYLYYVFTQNTGTGSFSYTMVDMSLDGGLGDVVSGTKNTILISTQTTEKITAVLHTNCEDIWVITHRLPNEFHAYQISSTGINPTPVVSTVGSVHLNPFGQMKATPEGTKIGICGGQSNNFFEILDFNNNTGVLSNPLTLNLNSPVWFEFSPDQSRLYIGQEGGFFQYNLLAGSPTAIENSNVNLGICGNLQLGPDQKIYVAGTGFGQNVLGVVHQPNALGLACNYIVDDINLLSGETSISLPNPAPYYLKPCPSPPTLSFDNLQNNYCQDTDDIILSASPSGGSFTVNGTPTTSFSSTTLGIGTHTVLYTYTDPSNCCKFRLSQEVEVELCCEEPVPNLSFTNLESQYCENNPEITLEASPSGGTFEINGNTSATILPSNLGLGIHTIKYIYTDSKGCLVELSQTIEVIDCPQDLFIPDLFSPNADGSNDIFTIASESINTLNLKIFDRHGNLLYETSNLDEAINQGWDGKNNGQEQPAGVYIWQIKGTFADGSKLQYKGKQKGTFYLMK